MNSFSPPPLPLSRLTAPKLSAEQQSPQRLQPRPQPPRGSVLIVEDDRAARRAIGAILRRQGYAVSEAGSVAEALQGLACMQPPPDWILLDLMLPDGSGVDVIRDVRGRGHSSRVCVITGCCVELLDQARRAGAEHAFTKPLDVQRLMTAMKGRAETHRPAV